MNVLLALCLLTLAPAMLWCRSVDTRTAPTYGSPDSSESETSESQESSEYSESQEEDRMDQETLAPRHNIAKLLLPLIERDISAERRPSASNKVIQVLPLRSSKEHSGTWPNLNSRKKHVVEITPLRGKGRDGKPVAYILSPAKPDTKRAYAKLFNKHHADHEHKDHSGHHAQKKPHIESKEPSSNEYVSEEKTAKLDITMSHEESEELSDDIDVEEPINLVKTTSHNESKELSSSEDVSEENTLKSAKPTSLKESEEPSLSEDDPEEETLKSDRIASLEEPKELSSSENVNDEEIPKSYKATSLDDSKDSSTSKDDTEEETVRSDSVEKAILVEESIATNIEEQESVDDQITSNSRAGQNSDIKELEVNQNSFTLITNENEENNVVSDSFSSSISDKQDSDVNVSDVSGKSSSADFSNDSENYEKQQNSEKNPTEDKQAEEKTSVNAANDDQDENEPTEEMRTGKDLEEYNNHDKDAYDNKLHLRSHHNHKRYKEDYEHHHVEHKHYDGTEDLKLSKNGEQKVSSTRRFDEDDRSTENEGAKDLEERKPSIKVENESIATIVDLEQLGTETSIVQSAEKTEEGKSEKPTQDNLLEKRLDYDNSEADKQAVKLSKTDQQAEGSLLEKPTEQNHAPNEVKSGDNPTEENDIKKIAEDIETDKLDENSKTEPIVEESKTSKPIEESKIGIVTEAYKASNAKEEIQMEITRNVSKGKSIEETKIDKVAEKWQENRENTENKKSKTSKSGKNKTVQSTSRTLTDHSSVEDTVTNNAQLQVHSTSPPSKCRHNGLVISQQNGLNNIWDSENRNVIELIQSAELGESPPSHARSGSSDNGRDQTHASKSYRLSFLFNK